MSEKETFFLDTNIVIVVKLGLKEEKKKEKK